MCTKTYKKSNVSVEVEIPFFGGQKQRKREKNYKNWKLAFHHYLSNKTAVS
jgi:hypothetical protein